METLENKTPEQLISEIGILKAKIADLESSCDCAKKKEFVEHIRVEHILDIIPDGVYIVNRQHDIEYINPAIIKEFGAVEGRKCYEFFHDRTEPCPWCKNSEVFAGKSIQWEWHSIRNDRDYELFDAPIVNADGTISKFERFHDITKLKHAVKALKESEERFRDITNSMADWIWEVDKEGKYTYCSEKVKEVLGYTSAEIIGKSPFDFIDPTNRDSLYEEISEIISRKANIKNLENWNICKDGRRVCLLTNGVPMLDSEGELLGYRGVDNDITNQKLSVEALLVSERRFRTYFKQGLIGMLITSVEKGIVEVNDIFCDLIGYSREELCKMSWTEMTHREDLAADLEQFNRILAGEINSYSMEKRFVRKDGKNIHLAFSVNAMHNADGSIDCFLTLCHDITERKKTMKELMEAKERAEESDRLKSAFLCNISHEIRTPMNGILGFLDLLKDPNLNGEEKDEYIEIINNSSERMLNTINDLIDISKIDAGQVEVSISETNINELTKKLYYLCKTEAEEKGIMLLLDNYLPDEEADIKTDREKIDVILKILIKNGIKFSKDGSIKFGYSIKGDELEFFVKDTGIGISADSLQAIFERFIQAEDYTIRNYEGSGLGLSICKSYVEMLGGKIRVESEEGNGSQFYFTIPYISNKKNIPESNGGQTDNIPAEQKSKLKILLAEDESSGVLLLSLFLKNIQKEILHARTGVEAIEIYRKNPDVDLILMDIRMPGMNGYDAAREIRKLNKDVIIIAQTAYALAGDRDEALKAGCNDYISKPIEKKVLLNTIGKYFNI